MMRVAYFDVGFSVEQYGVSPTRYGGGAVAARYLKQDPEVDLVIFAPTKAFDNWTEGVDRGTPIALHTGNEQAFRMGAPISSALDYVGGHFDLVLHGHTCHALNRGTYRGPMVHWSGFDGSAGHPGNDYVLLYDPSFRAQFGERVKHVRIGKPVPVECPITPREPFVFYCGRHDTHMNSIETARQAKAAGIPVVFAGPIHGTYPLLDHCDGALIRYVGEIDEATKLDYCRRAALFAMPHQWDVPFSQSVIDAQGQGCPIWVTQRGPFFAHYLKPGVNGFTTELPLAQAFVAAGALEAEDSWRAAREYDVSVMCRTFKQAFTEIVAEWRTEHPSP